MIDVSDNIIFNSQNNYIEICELPEEDLAGRVKIKMSALTIHPDNSQWNKNGITWLEQYVQDNIDSAIGMPYVVSWMDEENQIPSDHGTMSYDDEGYVQFDGVAVGTVLDAYITNININGKDTRVLMTEGYLYKQRYSKFIDWLKNEIQNGSVHGSIEINGKGKLKTIEYLNGSRNEDGSLKMGRIPTVFDFSGLAILYLTEPADDNSIVFEVNSKGGESVPITINNSKDSAIDGKWSDPGSKLYKPLLEEKNSSTLLHEAYLIVDSNYKNSPSTSLHYPHHKIIDNELVLHISGVQAALSRLMANDPNNVDAKKHLLRHYKQLGLEIPDSLQSLEKNDLNVVTKGKTVEINKLSCDDIATLITRAINVVMGSSTSWGDYYIYKFYPTTSEVVFTKWNSVGEYYMTTYTIQNSTVIIGDVFQVEEDWKPVVESQPLEVNAEKIKEIINKERGKLMTVEELNAKITELSNQISELNNKINELNFSNAEKDNKISELNEALVNANKTIEELNTKYSSLEAEYNKAKEDKEKMEKEKKQAEVNAYFENEIPKNGFDETEINTLKEYVEKCDLEGLKNAEKELVFKRFKEGKFNPVETNSKKEENIFFHTKEEKIEVNDVEAERHYFFKLKF